MKMKRILAILLAATMTIGSVGCMKSSSGESGGGKKSTQKKVEAPDDIWAPYKEEVTITTCVAENLNIQWREGDSHDDNPWYREYKKRFNVNLKNAWVSNDFDTKLNLCIADGDLPDVFGVTAKQLKELKEADMIWDLTEVFDKYASDEVKSYMEKDKDTAETGKIDGKLWGIPVLHYGFIDQPSMVWIRKDWKEEAKAEDPKTMDELVALAKTFKEKHGKYAITEDQNLSCMKALAPAWGAHPTLWVETKDGKIEHGIVQPEMKKVLETYAQWYKDGLLDPEFTTKDWAKKNQGIINGDVGIDPGYQYWAYSPGPDVVSNQGKEGIFEAYEVPTATGEPVLAPIRFANQGYIVISKKCQNPEAALKIINFAAYIEKDGQEKESEELMSSLYDDAYGDANALGVIDPGVDYEKYEKVIAAMEKYNNGEKIDPKTLGSAAPKYIDAVAFMETGEPSKVGQYLQMGSPKCAYSVTKKMLDNDQIMKDKVWGLSPESWQASSGALNTILIEGFTKIIVGKEPVDYFDTLVEQWYKAGGEKATNDVNEQYGNK